MQPILDLKNLTFSYHSKEGETKALNNLSFCVNEGDFVGLVGPSGCGKTTILNLLAGIISPASGSILLNGEPLNLSLDKVALMPQRDQLFEWRTIEKNIMLGLEIRKNATKPNKELALNLL
ncbi:MAG TPA: ATP-binding cassette domain-containing protein, partial [Clostridia bacterium]|nr:ATP-binding cassette domain-containing protein [Clostridia bacterium]